MIIDTVEMNIKRTGDIMTPWERTVGADTLPILADWKTGKISMTKAKEEIVKIVKREVQGVIAECSVVHIEGHFGISCTDAYEKRGIL